MGIDFYRLKQKYIYGIIPRIVKKKTTLKIDEVVLIFDLLLFFIKREILKRGRLQFIDFGVFYLKKFKRKGYKIQFKNSKTMKKIISKGEKVPFVATKFIQSEELKPIIDDTAKCVGMRLDQVCYILNLFIYGVYQELLTNGTIKLRNFGIFYLVDRVYGKEQIKSRNANFRPKLRFRREANGKEQEIETLKRVSRLLKLNHFSDENPVKNKK